MFQKCSTFGVCSELRTKVALHFECTFGTLLESKRATHLEHESATCGGCYNWCKNFVSVQFASLNRQWRGRERDRFGGFCTPKRVPIVQHIWRPKMFQTYSTFGVCLELRTKVAVHFDCTFGTVLASKCATHLEHESATYGGCSNSCKILVSVQFASLNRQWRGKERDRFGGF